jgi:regulatory protein YycI of two-component signal transduction system YycFG
MVLVFIYMILLKDIIHNMLDNIIYIICFLIIIIYLYKWVIFTKKNKHYYTIENNNKNNQTINDNDNIEKFNDISRDKYANIRHSLIATDYKYKNVLYYEDINDESFNYYTFK